MSEQFKVGDICIGQNHIFDLEYNGMECEIIEAFGLHDWHDPDTYETGKEFGYIVLWADGVEAISNSCYIRKKQPPQSAKAIMRAAILKAKQPLMVPA